MFSRSRGKGQGLCDGTGSADRPWLRRCECLVSGLGMNKWGLVTSGGLDGQGQEEKKGVAQGAPRCFCELEGVSQKGGGTGWRLRGRVRSEVGGAGPRPPSMPPGVGGSPSSPRQLCGVPGPICAVLHLKSQSGRAPPEGGFLGSRPQNRMHGMWHGGERLCHQSLFLAPGVYF